MQIVHFPTSTSLLVALLQAERKTKTFALLF